MDDIELSDHFISHSDSDTIEREENVDFGYLKYGDNPTIKENDESYYSDSGTTKETDKASAMEILYCVSNEKDQPDIVQHFLSEGDNALETIDITFDMKDGMKPKDNEEDNVKIEIYQILVQFKELLTKIKNLKRLPDSVASFVRFPYFVSKKSVSCPREKKKRIIDDKMSKIHTKVAQGLLEDAIQECLTYFSQEPNNPEPVKLLSFLYKEIGDSINSLKFSFTSALLSASNSFQWHYLGMGLIKNGDMIRGMECLEKSFNMHPRYIPNIWESACYLYLNQQYFKVLCVLMCFLKYAITEYIEEHIHLFKQTVYILLNHFNTKRIPQHIETFLNNIYPRFDYELFVVMCDKLYADNLYQQLFEKIAFHSNLSSDIKKLLTTELNHDAIHEIFHAISEYSIDTQIQFLLTFIHLCDRDCVIRYTIEHISKLENAYNKYYIDIVQCLFAKDMSELVISLPLPSQYKDIIFENNIVRLKFIKSHVSRSNWSDALYLSTIISAIPNPFYYHIFAILLHWIDGSHENILPFIILLTEDFNTEEQPKQLVYEILDLLLSNDSNIFNYEQNPTYTPFIVITLMTYLSIEDINKHTCIDYEKISKYLKQVVTALSQLSQLFTDNLINCITLISNRYATKDPFYKKIYIHSRFLSISSSMVANSFDVACYSLLELIQSEHMNHEFFERNTFWNLFSFIINNYENLFDRRRIIRLLKKFQTSQKTQIYLLLSYLQSSNMQKYSVLNCCYKACQLSNTSPFPNLVFGVHLLNLAVSKNIKNRPSIAMQAYYYINLYFKLSNGYESAESCYNMGRFFHILGQFTFAANFYHKSLKLCGNENHSNTKIISRSAAYNLALVYSNFGNVQLCNTILRMYLTV